MTQMFPAFRVPFSNEEQAILNTFKECTVDDLLDELVETETHYALYYVLYRIPGHVKVKHYLDGSWLKGIVDNSLLLIEDQDSANMQVKGF